MSPLHQATLLEALAYTFQYPDSMSALLIHHGIELDKGRQSMLPIYFS